MPGLEIQVSEIRIDGRGVPRADFEILLDFACRLVVRANGEAVYDGVEFPLVEFASQVAEWFAAGRTQDFDYDSMESEVVGFLYFHRAEGGWRIGSMLPGERPSVLVTDDELDRGVQAFLSFVPMAIDKFGVDVRRFVKLTDR